MSKTTVKRDAELRRALSFRFESVFLPPRRDLGRVIGFEDL